MMRTILPLCVCLSVAVLAQDRVVFEQQPALRLSNDKLAMTVFPEASCVLKASVVPLNQNVASCSVPRPTGCS